jgi:molybdenum cofactor guanylyltransferase
MLDVEGFILVGGQSSRMGVDKSTLLFSGKTGIELIAATLLVLTNRVRLVGSRGSAPPALENVADTYHQWGALGGIHAALAACEAEWAVIVACDLPLVTAGLFERLASFAEANYFDAVVPIQEDGRPQPLCALYRGPCLPITERLISQGEHTPRTLLAQVQTRWVELAELRDLDGSEHFFLNVNTPADYRQAQQLMTR